MNLSVNPWRYELHFVLQYEQHISEGKLQGCIYVTSPFFSFFFHSAFLYHCSAFWIKFGNWRQKQEADHYWCKHSSFLELQSELV